MDENALQRITIKMEYVENFHNFCLWSDGSFRLKGDPLREMFIQGDGQFVMTRGQFKQIYEYLENKIQTCRDSGDASNVMVPSLERSRNALLNAVVEQLNMSIVPSPKLKRDYVGWFVRTTREMSNGYVTIPAGKIAKVEGQNRLGSTLKFQACECCGMQAILSRVQPSDMEFIEYHEIEEQHGH